MEDKNRTAERPAAGPAVLVSCIEKPNVQTAALDADPAEFMTQVLSDAASPVPERSAALVERVRTKLTVVRGFSQLLRRRQLREDPHADVHELERISEAVRELDDLLYRFEYSGR